MIQIKYVKIAWWILFICTLWIILELMMNRVPFIDQVTRQFVPMFPHGLHTFFRYVTELGSKTFVIPFVILFAIFIFFKTKKWSLAVLFAATPLFSHFLNLAIKSVFIRERPSSVAAYDALGYSFPSGHAMISFVCYSLVAYMLVTYVVQGKRQLYIILLAVLIILLIGFSRFVLNVHYLSDIIVGYFFASILVYICIKWMRKIEY